MSDGFAAPVPVGSCPVGTGEAVAKCKFYPEAARQAGQTGTVKVRVTFDRGGGLTGYFLFLGSYSQI